MEHDSADEPGKEYRIGATNEMWVRREELDSDEEGQESLQKEESQACRECFMNLIPSKSILLLIFSHTAQESKWEVAIV